MKNDHFCVMFHTPMSATILDKKHVDAIKNRAEV